MLLQRLEQDLVLLPTERKVKQSTRPITIVEV